MRLWRVSSLVALSTTKSGVVTLPQSCSQAPIRNSRHSDSEAKPKEANGPLDSFSASRASISASSGTRAQWPPVWELLASIAPATRAMIASTSRAWSSISRVRSTHTAAWLARASIRR